MVETVKRCINQFKLQFQHLLETRFSRCVRQAEVCLIHSVAACIATFLILLLHPSIVLDQSECGWAPPSIDPSDPKICSIIHPWDDPSCRDTNRYDPTHSITWIRTMFHILAEDDSANPASTTAIVESQINQLNNDFLPYGYQFTWDVRTWSELNNSLVAMYADTLTVSCSIEQSLGSFV